MIQTEREAVQYIEEGVAHVSDTLLDSLLPIRMAFTSSPWRTFPLPYTPFPLTSDP